ncbi:MAG: Acetamidase [Alyxoria varia]|nr:MAG: Acetamidase [Alyxoria varia]
MGSSSNWKELAERKRESVLSLIPPEWRIENPPSAKDRPDVAGDYIRKFLTAQESEITETDAVGIAAKTTTGVWKAVDVTRAFCHRAALAAQLLNCLAEIFFDAGLARARALDEHLVTHGKPVGPLHGVPISLKDQFHVKGVETCMGYVGWIGTFQGAKNTGKERNFESEMVKMLSASGAVLYCKTSVPHTLMSPETSNNITGYCPNPRNRAHISSGGSSGGEGALIHARGSCLGFGTDIGGSIRIPAGFNGLYGVKPSSGRLPYQGMANSIDGQNTVVSVVGPLATTPGSLRLVMKSILAREPWLHDPAVVELPWREEHEILPGKLAFGVINHDGVVTPHPPVRRAIITLVDVLRKHGHTCFDWNPPEECGYNKLIQVGIKAFTFDGGHDPFAQFALSEEPVSCPQVANLLGEAPVEQKNAGFIAETNVERREVLKGFMEYWNGTGGSGGVRGDGDGIPSSQPSRKRNAHGDAVPKNDTTTTANGDGIDPATGITQTSRPVDAIICPIAPWAAATIGGNKYLSYTLWVNALDYTVVIVPVTRCDRGLDVRDEGFEGTGEFDREMMGLYDPEKYHGLPVALQLVGRRFQEEKMVAVAEYVGALLKGEGLGL